MLMRNDDLMYGMVASSVTNHDYTVQSCAPANAEGKCGQTQLWSQKMQRKSVS